MGCNRQTPTEIPTPMSERPLLPYWTLTPTQIQESQQTNSATLSTPTKVPTLTPTPVTYKVVEGDTLTSIAYQHGVKLNDLLTANPGVDPNFLTIGITITIPINDEAIVAFPLPTPIALVTSQPKCYATSDGGLWCLFLVENNQPFSVENISGVIYLTSPELESALSEAALPPLTILHPGQRIPLMANFHSEIPNIYSVQAETITLLPVQENDSRYLKIEVTVNEISFSPSRKSATILGEFQLTAENPPESQIRLAAIAYDLEGNPIGVRRWESKELLSQNQLSPFRFTVFSLGPPIDTVEILGEATPEQKTPR